MKTVSDLCDTLSDDAYEAPVVFKAPDGRRYTITGWQFIQDHTESSELVVELESEAKP